ncbi:hypothetical protein CPB84DRAFT_1755308 [Gymnopilus junonius]|uniref:Uncharacterized protein n=1 Tax=Gymnopilus junonius TaxID=109634 RepID=A0A9P5N974_GYMJU|nr:hypothetical protein CPB84DRAFT_1755308 [Gymnopilus junonius]
MTEGAGTEERDDVALLVTQPICEVLDGSFQRQEGRLLNVLLQCDAASQTPESQEEVLGLMELNAAMFYWLSLNPVVALAVLLGLYYYSPARRTRMEEEDLEGIELEAGGGGAGNIRRRAG